MESSAYFDVASDKVVANPRTLAANYNITPAGTAPVANIQILPVTLVLQEALFTGSVTSANWTFAVSVLDKLWISKKTSLYFGKTATINRPVFHGNVKIVNHKLSLDVSVTAYNMYGDVARSTQHLQMFFLEGNKQDQMLFQFEQNRNSLTLKFAAILDK